MRVKFDKWLVHIPFYITQHIANFGRRSIFNLFHIPYNSHKKRLFFYHCADKGNRFFSLEEKYGNEINCQVVFVLFRYVLHAVH